MDIRERKYRLCGVALGIFIIEAQQYLLYNNGI